MASRARVTKLIDEQIALLPNRHPDGVAGTADPCSQNLPVSNVSRGQDSSTAPFGERAQGPLVLDLDVRLELRPAHAG